MIESYPRVVEVSARQCETVPALLSMNKAKQT